MKNTVDELKKTTGKHITRGIQKTEARDKNTTMGEGHDDILHTVFDFSALS